MASPVSSSSSSWLGLFQASSGRTVADVGGYRGAGSFRPGGQQKRWVAAAVKRRYKGTARREEALTELIEKKVAEAREACEGKEISQEEGCRVAWDEVEEVSQAKADLRRRLSESPADPLEPFCAHNPLSDDCTVVYVD